MPSQPRRDARPRPTATPATPGQELVQQAGGLPKFIATYQGDFGRVMPKHTSVEAFMGLALAYVRRDEKLRDAANVNPGSLILALRECAALGHTPMSKIYALVPFRDRNAPGGWSVVGIETYHGVIERMFRAGAVQAVKSELVRAGDMFEFDPLQQAVTLHRYDPHASDDDRGPLAGTYAWAVMLSGARSQMVWMNRHEVMKHKAVAKTDAFWTGPWEPDMWRKTGLLKLENYVPTSAEYLWNANASAAASSTGFVGVPEPRERFGLPDETIYDAELVDDQAGKVNGPGPQQPAGDQGEPPAGETGTGWPATRRPPDATDHERTQHDATDQ